MTEKVFRGSWLFPISRPPIKNGWVLTHGHTVLELGAGRPPSGYAIEELDDVAILPGLVNAHTHLEFSALMQPLGFPGITLHQWIGLVIGVRSKRRRDPGRVIADGLAESRAAGVRLVAEIATTPWAGFRSHVTTDTVAFAEVLGLAAERATEKLAAATAHLAKASVAPHISGAISPHAPYSTSLATVRSSVQLARKHGVPVAMHLAESPAERELIEQGTGPFAETLREMGLFDEQLFPVGENATLQFLELLAQAPAALVVHGNDLRQQELDFIEQHRTLTVVYCPRTHAFFGYPPHPLNELLRRGAPVALGTDSRASNPDLSVWNEVRWLLEHRPDVPWQDVLAMATIHGANALQRSDLGRIEPGAACGLIAVAGGTDTADQLVERWITGGQPRFLTEPADGTPAEEAHGK